MSVKAPLPAWEPSGKVQKDFYWPQEKGHFIVLSYIIVMAIMTASFAGYNSSWGDEYHGD